MDFWNLEIGNIPNEYPNIFMRWKSLEWIPEYICSGKIHEYLGERIYLSINIRINSYIQIFATHWYNPPFQFSAATRKWPADIGAAWTDGGFSTFQWLAPNTDTSQWSFGNLSLRLLSVSNNKFSSRIYFDILMSKTYLNLTTHSLFFTIFKA